MILRRSVLSGIGLAGAALAGATAWRVRARAARAQTAHPPEGQLLQVGSHRFMRWSVARARTLC